MVNKMTGALVAFVALSAFLPLIAFAHVLDSGTPLERYKHAREHFAEARDAYSTAKDTYTQAKQDYASTRNITAFQEHVKTFLGKSVDAMIRVLEKAKTREGADVAELDGYIAELNDFKTRLAAAQNRSDFVGIARDLHKRWVEIRHELRKEVAENVGEKLRSVYQNANGLVTKLDRVLANLSAQGKDVSALQAKLDQAKAKITEAGDAWQAAKDLLQQAQNAGNETRKEVVQQAVVKLKDGHAALREAHSLLKEVVNGIRAIVKEQPVVESNENETEQPETT